MRRVQSNVTIRTEPNEDSSINLAPHSPTSPLTRLGSQLQRRTASGRQLGKKKASGNSIAQRIELARRRMEAAHMIQRAWHRWYVSIARRRRIEAARKIQHAWAGTFYVANAKRELQFLRWLKQRRETLRGKWKSLLRGLEHRRQWAFVIIAAFKNVCIWKIRLIKRRRNRYARSLQRWWRQLMFNRQTNGIVLAAMELRELLRLENTLRTLVVKEYRASVMHTFVAGRDVLIEGHARTLQRWHGERQVPYAAHPTMEAAMTRYGEKLNADEAVRVPLPGASLRPEVTRNMFPTKQSSSSSSSLREFEEVDATPVTAPRLIPSRPMSSRGREQTKPKGFSIAVRPPSATVRNSRRPQQRL